MPVMTKSNVPAGRRDFLKGALAASALVLTARQNSLAALVEARRFAPVKVARNRVIREVVGLRPYRAAGFRVEAERLGAKLLVHNYGHGGAGITLSWGTASQAVDLARDFIVSQSNTRKARPVKHRRFAVIGCGVNGLSTARLLQMRFQDGPGTVTLYAKDLPPETTSNIAGGFWFPTSVYDSTVATKDFKSQFRIACRLSNRAFQNLVGSDYGVRWIDTLEFHRNETAVDEGMPGGSELYYQKEIHRDPENYFGFPYVRQFSTMLIEPPVYLNALLRDFYLAGGKLVTREFRSLEEIERLPEQIIFNCTGLGSHVLFGDEQLEPVRGQLEVLLPQPEIDYCYVGSGHMFPRRDGIVLGGTFDHGDWSLAPNPDQANAILDAHTEIMKGLKSS